MSKNVPFYTAIEIGKLIGVSAVTIRRWDKNGKLKPSYKNSRGVRFYTQEQVKPFTHKKDKK